MLGETLVKTLVSAVFFFIFVFSRKNLDGKKNRFGQTALANSLVVNTGAKSKTTLQCPCLLEGEISCTHSHVEGEAALPTLLVQ